MPHRRAEKGKSSGYTLEDIIRDIRALNSSVLLLSQKMNYLVRNEKILGRNFIILNKKLKAFEQKKPVASVQSEGVSTEVNDLVEELEEKVKQNDFMLNEIKSDLNKMNSSFAKSEDLKELKYIIEAINPLEFVTLGQVKDLISNNKSSAPKTKKKKTKK